jgi:two-component sensor histidine kinase
LILLVFTLFTLFTYFYLFLPTFTYLHRFYYILKVSDNGKGISKEIDFQNTGTLGLQLVNILVEQIDGCIELKKGKGTEFIIRFNNAEV